jgi:hypothetical protein
MKTLIKSMVAALFLTAALNSFAADAHVSIYSAESTTFYYKGGMQSAKFQVLVDDLAFEKKVYIHYTVDGIHWNDMQTSFKADVEGNKELWIAEMLTTPALGGDFEYVVKYEVNGNVYWDNNNGQNYTLGSNDGVFLKDVNVLNIRDYNSFTVSSNDHIFYNFQIAVKNIAYEKSVKVVYTLDNWETSDIIELNYMSVWSFGYTSVPSPNDHNVEVWADWDHLDVGSESTEMKYFIEYIVDGQTYYDNNFGQDYTIMLDR